MNEPDLDRLRNDLRATLAAHRTPAGGWPYVAGKSARIEPTCWALLATASAAEVEASALVRWPRADDWLVDVPGAPANVAFNALAGLTLLAARRRPDAERIARRVSALRSAKLAQSDLVRLDTSLRAWPWVDGTASWVEPTAWCLLFLKRRGPQETSPEARERVDVGERMLLDRVCREGGWNYGNSQVYGRDLWPYVPTTAIALLALQDRRDHPDVQRSLEQLQADVTSEQSMLAVALTLLCLQVLRSPTDAVRLSLARLCESARAQDRWHENLMAVAVAACALSSSERVRDAFTL